MSQDDAQQDTLDVWRNVCFHIDGMAIATSVFALDRAGVFDRLEKATAPLDVAALAVDQGLRDGYLNLAFRLLDMQGYVERSGDSAAGRSSVRLTAGGTAWLAHLPAYHDAPARVARARAILAVGDITEPAFDQMGPAVPLRVQRNVEGAEVAAVMTAFTHDSAFARLADAGKSGLNIGELSSAGAAKVLAAQGWFTIDDGIVRLTDAGRVAMQMAPQYFYPASYLATLASVPDLLGGHHDPTTSRAEDGTEAHVDRELDIEFSGLVFARTCRDPLFELAMPLFDRLPLDAQPKAIVDCGAGDGTLLCEMYDAIMGRTARGHALDSHPLVMVGVEYNPVAERVLAERLGAANIPSLVFAGDIGDPEAIVRRLSAEGFGADDLLHVSKSVFHNRTYAGTPAGPAATSAGAFVAPGGERLTAAHVEADLEALFVRWRECLGRHGLVVVEAHIADAGLTTARLGRSVTTWLEASHGYSHQYLVEAGVHRAAARRAGLQTRGAHDFGTEITGAAMMTIDHYGV